MKKDSLDLNIRTVFSAFNVNFSTNVTEQASLFPTINLCLPDGKEFINTSSVGCCRHLPLKGKAEGADFSAVEASPSGTGKPVPYRVRRKIQNEASISTTSKFVTGDPSVSASAASSPYAGEPMIAGKVYSAPAGGGRVLISSAFCGRDTAISV